MRRPESSEYNSYYQQYIDLVKGENPIKALENQIIAMQAFLSEIPEEKENYTYAPNKWTIKEVIGHLSDTERIFGTRVCALPVAIKHPCQALSRMIMWQQPIFRNALFIIWCTSLA